MLEILIWVGVGIITILIIILIKTNPKKYWLDEDHNASIDGNGIVKANIIKIIEDMKNWSLPEPKKEDIIRIKKEYEEFMEKNK